MKHSRLVPAALGVLALGTWATLAFACGDDKTSASAASSSKSTACSAAMAAKCTPEMAAACKSKSKTTSAATYQTVSNQGHAGCPNHNQSTSVNAVTLSNTAPKGTVDAVTLAGPSAQQVDAVLVGSGAGCNHGSSATAGTASAAGTAVVAGSGSCSGHGASAMAKNTDCDACADMAFCDGEAKSMGATVQVVPLKNGVMYVYTASDPSKVHAVQASMGRRNDRMVTLLSAGDKAHLCPSCKSVRGAIASGKLNRELVNIEGGCLTLMTSNDPATLAKIYSMAGLKGPMTANVKS